MLTEMVLPNLQGGAGPITCATAVLVWCACSWMDYVPRVWQNLVWVCLLLWLLLDSYSLLLENEKLKQERDVSLAPLIKYMDERLVKTEKTFFALIDAQRFREDVLFKMCHPDKTKSTNWRKARSFSYTMI